MTTTYNAQIELNSYAQQPLAATLTDVEQLPNDATNPSDPNEGFSLPPTDGGKNAWLCLISCFMLEALIWGASRHRLGVGEANLNSRLSVLLWRLPRVLYYE